jgi:putative FmdB family regulatory protein
MPIYEYSCQKCGEKFEKFVRSSCCQSEVHCPKCDAAEVSKAFSVFGMGAPKSASACASSGSCALKGG